MDELTLRKYRPSDATAVSRLFRDIYGDHYVQPHVYLPWMINQNHHDGRWHSLVAVTGNALFGHATLSRNKGSHMAELALSVVHPATRGQKIATQLGRLLLIHAQALSCRGVAIKQVTQHLHTQRMAERLGFVSTGLMLDHVPSPFGEPLPETIVIGYTAIDSYRRPLPALEWPESCQEFMQHLCSVFGTREKDVRRPGPSLTFEQHGGRYEVYLDKLDNRLLKQLQQLPQQWTVSIGLRLASGFAAALHNLSTIGFAFTGIAPDEAGDGWLALFHRGYRQRSMTLHCPHMQQLHDQAQQQAARLTAAATPCA